MAIDVRRFSKRLGATARRLRWSVLATWLVATAFSAGFWAQVALRVGEAPRHAAAGEAPPPAEPPPLGLSAQ